MKAAYNAGSSLSPILVVEDNNMDFDFCQQAFIEHGVVNPVVHCSDGEQAVQFIDAHPDIADKLLPMLVLLDLRLPKVDGIEVLRHARQHPVWKKVPFVILTTSGEDSDISAAYQFGVNSYIVKPVDFGKFSEVVRNIKSYWLITNEPPYAPSGQ